MCSKRRAPPASGASCTAAPAACTATSSHPPANEDAPFNPGRRLSGHQARRRAARRGLRPHQRARRRGRAADWHLRPWRHALPEDVSRPRPRTFSDARARRGLLPPHVHRRPGGGLRLCGTVPAAAGRTYILAGPRYTTLEQLVALIATRTGRQAAALCTCRCGRSGLAGLLCEVDLSCRSASSRRSIRRRVDFYTQEPRLRHHPRAHGAGLRAGRRSEDGIARTAEWYRREGLL